MGGQRQVEAALRRLQAATERAWMDDAPPSSMTVRGDTLDVVSVGRACCWRWQPSGWHGRVFLHGVEVAVGAAVPTAEAAEVSASWLALYVKLPELPRPPLQLTDEGRAWQDGTFAAHSWRVLAAAAAARDDAALASLVAVAAEHARTAALRPLLVDGQLRLSRVWGLPPAVVIGFAPVADNAVDVLDAHGTRLHAAADPQQAVAAAAAALPEGLQAVPGSAAFVPP